MLKKLCFLSVLIVLPIALSGCAAIEKQGPSGDNGDRAAEETRPDQTQNQPNELEVTDGRNNASAGFSAKIIDKNNMTNGQLPPMTIDQEKSYSAVIHTDAGDMELSLNAKAVPITVNNFVWLAKQGYYDNTIFHRVIKTFMIQGGDPRGDGTGGPGYQFDDEKFSGEYSRGTIAMANAGPNTNGSQFFIMHNDYPLPKNYVIFGKVTSGLDTLDKIAEAQVKLSRTGEMSQPLVPVKITSIEIAEK